MYRALFNWTIFSDSWIQSVLQDCAGRLEDVPRDIAPPGTLLLLFHRDPRIRQLAQQQASKATFVPIPSDQFVGMYNEVLNSVVELMSSPSSVSRTCPTLGLCTDGSDQWRAFHAFLRHVPPELLKVKHHNADVRHVVVGHLHHNGSRT
jgi:senataxin